MGNIRNIGIFAHVDAGKTTLSEQLLSCAGAIRSIGSVDAGTAHTDTLPVERRRGISVKATCVSFTWKDVQINLIDTPGHVDFSAEVERSLWALDGAIVVVCAVEGVQPHTQLLFSALQAQNIPVVFFLNKTDRTGADPNAVLTQIQRRLSKHAFDPLDTQGLLEYVCDHDEALLEQYLSGQIISDDTLRQASDDLCRKGVLYPVLRGSALRSEGITELLDMLIRCLPEAADVGVLSAIAFAAQQHKVMGRGLWMRVFGGRLDNRDTLTLTDGVDPVSGEPLRKEWKISQICRSDGTPAGKLESGEIGIVYGLGNTPIGTVIGAANLLPRTVQPGTLRTPLITVQALPERPEQMQTLRQACEILSGEDPLLNCQYIRALNQLNIQVMGTIQLEILQEILLTRFDLKVTFGPPAIIYKETIAQSAQGYVAYLAPKPCWAILRFQIEPGPRGSGVKFVSQVGASTLQTRYQNQVAQAIPLALNQGRLGWQVTDVVITLLDGNEHKFHTHPLDFIVATPMAIQDALNNGGSVLLEPILQCKFLLPQDCVGKVMNDINTMRGEVLHTESDGDSVTLDALIPVKTSLDYSITLPAITGGRGAMSARLHSYRECPLELGQTAQRRSVDPLDTSKYILAARSALEGGIFRIDSM